MRLIVDAHEDLSWNMLCYGRDYRRSALETRAREAGSPLVKRAGLCALGLPEWLAGHVAIVFGTIFSQPKRSKLADRFSPTYLREEQAHQQAVQQLDLYRRFIDENEQIRLVQTQSDLDAVLASWQALPDGETPGAAQQIGIVLLMENADPIRTPEEVEWWYEQGLRLIGPAWMASRYCGGTGEPGPFTPEGFRMLEHMQELNMVLDTSHMAEQAFFQAIDRYAGPIIASHSNPRQFVKGDRHLSDEMIHALVERDAVIGCVLFNMFLVNGWRMGDRKEAADLNTIIRAIDYVCQRTGNAQHSGIGTDFDGAFGSESIPLGLDTIADLQKLDAGLTEAGYSSADIEAILGGNWLRILRKALPN